MNKRKLFNLFNDIVFIIFCLSGVLFIQMLIAFVSGWTTDEVNVFGMIAIYAFLLTAIAVPIITAYDMKYYEKQRKEEESSEL